MNSYGLYALIAIMVTAGTLAVVPTYASIASEKEECPECGDSYTYIKPKLLTQGEIPVLVWTDSTKYDHESTIRVYGAVANFRGDAPVTITVYGPQNNLVSINQIEISEDKTFETTFSTAGSLFKQNGIYTIRVQYGTEEIKDKVTVELVDETIGQETGGCAADELAVMDKGKAYCVPYEITGATVTKSTVSSATTSIVLMIDAQSDGSILLAVPRSILDSQTNGVDSDFIVLVDGEEADYVEIDNDDTMRALEIAFSGETTEIEIIGTYAVPEFGTIAAIILAVAIVSIIAVSARSRLSILPRY
jgi:predicted secreted protein with PEFG-CTERM motif